MRATLVVAMVLMFCGDTNVTWAQSTNKAAAEQLFQEGRALLQQGLYEEAIARFEASLALEPGSGTLGNLAVCYERLGKLASAWGLYREAADRADREGNTERARTARGLASALEPRLSRLIIRLPARHVPAGLVVERNGIPVPAAVLGTAVYVDPGKHELSATALGHKRFFTTITVGEAEERTFELPELAPLAEPTERVETGPVDSARIQQEARQISPEATRMYEERFVGYDEVTGAQGLGTRQVAHFWVGKFKRPIADAAFYDTVGRPDLTERYTKRNGWRWGGVIAGAAVATVGSVLMWQSFEIDYKCELGDPNWWECVEDESEAQERRFVGGLALASLGMGAGALSYWAVDPHPVPLSERRRLVDEHNRKLGKKLGLPTIPDRVISHGSTVKLSFKPRLTSGFQGLMLEGRF